jgi:hypothetical protein
MKSKKEVKKQKGGKRIGAGRTPKFSEETTTFSCRVPISKKPELIEYVNTKLSEWSVK